MTPHKPGRQRCFALVRRREGGLVMLGAVTRVSVPLGSLMVVAAIIAWATGLSQRASDAVELDSSVAAHLMGGQIDADHKCIASISCTAMWDTLRPCPGAN